MLLKINRERAAKQRPGLKVADLQIDLSKATELLVDCVLDR